MSTHLVVVVVVVVDRISPAAARRGASRRRKTRRHGAATEVFPNRRDGAASVGTRHPRCCPHCDAITEPFWNFFMMPRGVSYDYDDDAPNDDATLQ